MAVDYSGLSCPCCGRADLAKHHERLDKDGRPVEIAVCLVCTALVNVSDLRASKDDNRKIQRESSEEFYRVTDDDLAGLNAKVASVGSIIDFALVQLPLTFPRNTFADFGAGMGYMAAAGAERFKASHAIEFNTAAINQLLPHFPARDKLTVSTDIADVGPVDLMTIWHTIEHMPDAQAMLKTIRAKLSPGGAMMFQCPMFHPEYVVRTHYFFLNEFACKMMCEMAGFGDVQVWHEVDSDFITCLARNNRADSHREVCAIERPALRSVTKPNMLAVAIRKARTLALRMRS